MERLTEHCCPGGIRIKGCSALYPAKERKGAPASNAIVRLAAYEDAMPLDWAQELAQAEKDGRVVVLPCKVGDAVYVTYGEGYRTCVVDRMYIMADNQVQVRMRHSCTETLWLSAAFGKTVFLTREEAEAALKKGEADNEAD